MTPEEKAKSDNFGRGYKQDFFWYLPPTPVVLVSTAPNATQNIQIETDSEFHWIAFSFEAFIDGGSVPISGTADAALPWPPQVANRLRPPVLLQITDTGSGKYLMSGPVPLAAFAGSGELPYRLPRPRVFPPNATISLNWTYIGIAGVTYTIYPVFHGFKRYVGVNYA